MPHRITLMWSVSDVVMVVIDYSKIVGGHWNVIICATWLVRIITWEFYVLFKINVKSHFPH